MLFSIHPSRRFPIQFAITYNTGHFKRRHRGESLLYWVPASLASWKPPYRGSVPALSALTHSAKELYTNTPSLSLHSYLPASLTKR
jgi:hypothetical protein